MSFGEFLERYSMIILCGISVLAGALTNNFGAAVWAFATLVGLLRINDMQDYTDELQEYIAELEDKQT